jgi:hypothetical protein
MDPLWAQGDRQYHRVFKKSRKKMKKIGRICDDKKSQEKQQEID